MINFICRYIYFVDKLNLKIGHALAWCLPLMAIITLMIIFLGSVFDTGWIWMRESVTYMHGILFTLAAAYTFSCDDHVRIDVFYRNFSPRRKAWCNLFGILLLLLPTCIVTFVYSLPYVISSWAVTEVSVEGKQGLPAVFLLKSCLIILPILLFLQGLSQAAKSWFTIIERKW